MPHLADQNDIDYILRLNPGSSVVHSVPAPITRFKSGPNKNREKINPHETVVYTDDGRVHRVFHIKPIYYEDKGGNWRPMSEIAEEFGNHYIKLKPNWRAMIGRKYLRWIHKRMQLINTGKPEELVLSKDEQGNPTKTVPQGLSEKVGQAFSRISDVALEALWNNPNF